MTPMRQHTKTSTEDQRIVQVATIIKHCAINCRNTHLVPIVANTIDDTVGNAMRRKNAWGQILANCTSSSKAEYICTGNGLRGNSQYVANHTSDTGICTTERLNSRRVIMCFDFESDIVGARKTNDSGVITECGYQPGWVDLLCSMHNILFEQAVDGFFFQDGAGTIHFIVVNSCLEGLVRTMFRPGLSEGFKLNI